MNALDFLLCVTLIIQGSNNVKHIHQKLAKMMKSTPRSLRGSLALFIKSKDPAAMLERVLNDWEAEDGHEIGNGTIGPDGKRLVGRDPITGRYVSLS